MGKKVNGPKKIFWGSHEVHNCQKTSITGIEDLFSKKFVWQQKGNWERSKSKCIITDRNFGTSFFFFPIRTTANTTLDRAKKQEAGGSLCKSSAGIGNCWLASVLLTLLLVLESDGGSLTHQAPSTRLWSKWESKWKSPCKMWTSLFPVVFGQYVLFLEYKRKFYL